MTGQRAPSAAIPTPVSPKGQGPRALGVGISLVLDGVLYQTIGYAWEGWHERPKAGFERFGEAARESSISELMTR